MTNRIFPTLAASAALLIGAGAALHAADADMSSVDADGDGVATLAEFRLGYPAMTGDQFARIDVNADGVVEAVELQTAEAQAVLYALGEKPAALDVAADLDADGHVTFAELAQVLPTFPQDLFLQLDVNGDGNLDMIEYNSSQAQAALTTWEEGTVFLVFEDVDLDADGILSVEELQLALPDRDPATLRPIDSAEFAAYNGNVIFSPVARID